MLLDTVLFLTTAFAWVLNANTLLPRVCEPKNVAVALLYDASLDTAIAEFPENMQPSMEVKDSSQRAPPAAAHKSEMLVIFPRFPKLTELEIELEILVATLLLWKVLPIINDELQ